MNYDKIYGAPQRQDGLRQIGRNRYEAQYGWGEDGGSGYNYRKRYRGKPAVSTLREEITADINERTQEEIVGGYEYGGVSVWLSTENQLNYKSAYDLAVQTDGASLPVTFKLGTDIEPVYKTFEDMEDFEAFYTGAVAHIQSALSAGWAEKDAIDWGLFEIEEEE